MDGITWAPIGTSASNRTITIDLTSIATGSDITIYFIYNPAYNTHGSAYASAPGIYLSAINGTTYSDAIFTVTGKYGAMSNFGNGAWVAVRPPAGSLNNCTVDLGDLIMPTDLYSNSCASTCLNYFK